VNNLFVSANGYTFVGPLLDLIGGEVGSISDGRKGLHHVVSGTLVGGDVIHIGVSSFTFLSVNKEVKEVNISVNTTGGESHIVFVPVDRADFLCIETKHFRSFTLVEIEDFDFLVLTSSSKEVTTVTEFDIRALLDGPLLKLMKFISS
jgi:hypothetical protein